MIYYIRDEEGSLIGLKYNDKVYYYIKNMQEDIIGITDENFNKIVEYEYDSWGNIITIKDNNGNIITDESHIGIINPFRYRSYYYDKETKLYYLNSRYYNPEWGRFINADGIIGNPNDIVDYNLYAYTRNNPIKNIDSNGKFELVSGSALAIFGLATLVLVAATAIRKTGAINIPSLNFPEISLPQIKINEKSQEKAKESTWEKVEKMTSPTTPSSKPCWEARLSKAGVGIELGNRISIPESVTRVISGKDVMCNNKFSAQMVANYFPDYYFDPPHHKKPGYYPHYHPYNWSHIHIWYFER